ncbi:hypothetical protein CTI12_AA032890 [Artemisia annua]|uniref:Uncharacterized protein n=1 Tax=Artemisia annua TaxID=35608 RepID=A0A2U1QGJ2_ARTAN|nr:hypothetical protein CTI12_AA032890 [Artemisia annua]
MEKGFLNVNSAYKSAKKNESEMTPINIDSESTQHKEAHDDEGFVEASKKKGKGKLQGTNRQVDGIRFQKPKVSYYYRPVTKPKNGGASTSKPSVQSNKGSPTVNVGSTCNKPTTVPTSSTDPP